MTQSVFRLLSGIHRISHGLSPILCHGRVLYVDVKADSFGVRFVEPCDLWQSSIRRALSTPRRNDWGSIRFHVPIDASVDVTDARNAYLEQYPKSAKEASTWWIEKNHIAHLRRLLDVRMPIMEMTAWTIQEYIYGEAY